MKRFTIMLALAMALSTATGCKTATVTPALAPGYLNSVDQTMGKTLTAVNDFITKMEADIATGVHTPSASEKIALNALITTTEAANQTYVAYHNGAVSQATAQAKINAAYAQQQTMAAAVNGGK